MKRAADSEAGGEPDLKHKKSTDDPFATGVVEKWLLGANAKNPSTGLVGGKSMRGSTVTGIVVETKCKSYGENNKSSFYINMITLLEDVSIGHSLSKAETEYQKSIGKEMEPRTDQLVLKRGSTLSFTSFKAPKMTIYHGSIVSVGGLVYSYRAPSEKSKVPEPSLSITGDIVALRSDPSFYSLRDVIKNIPAPTEEEICALSVEEDNKPEFPAESLLESSYGINMWDFNKIPVQVLYDRSYKEHYCWFILDNTVFHRGSVMEQYKDFECPIFVISHPPEGEEAGADKKNYLCKEKKDQEANAPLSNADDDSLLVAPCIRKTVAGTKDYVLEGQSVGTDEKMFVNMPIYEAQEMYNVHTKELWPLVGGQLFRGTRAVVSMRLKLSSIMQHREHTTEYKLFGYPVLHLDYVALMNFSGYKITKEFAVEWLRKNYETSTTQGWDFIKPTKNLKNPANAIFYSPDFYMSKPGLESGLAKERVQQLRLVCLNEVTCEPQAQFDDSWQFYAIQTCALRDAELYERKNFEWMREEAIPDKNEREDACALNAELVQSHWGISKQMAKKVVIMAVNMN